MAKMNRTLHDLDKNYIKFEDKKITVILDNNSKLWFSGLETGEVLEYNFPKQAIQQHVRIQDKIQLKDINTDVKINKHPQTVFISEAGLYKLIMKSKQKKAEKIQDWVTEEVLPSIREFGYYKFKEKKDKEIDQLLKKINSLTKELDDIKNDLKEEKFPNGAVFYVINYTDQEGEKYRIGITDDMKKRKKIYDTHMLHKKPVVFYEEIKKPEKLEMCVRSMLYDYRYKNKKDFFICSKEKIEKAIKNSKKGLNSIEQNGGANILKYYEEKIEEFKNLIIKNNKEIEVQKIVLDDFKEKFNKSQQINSNKQIDSDEKPKKKSKK